MQNPNLIWKWYHNNEPLLVETYKLNGQLHRVDGPAVILYYSDNMVKSEAYYLKDQLHREDGPAVIQYNKDGIIERTKYCLHGAFMEHF